MKMKRNLGCCILSSSAITSVSVRGAVSLLKVLYHLEHRLSKSQLYRAPRALVLDTLLGPPEDFEYVSTTTPVASS